MFTLSRKFHTRLGGTLGVLVFETKIEDLPYKELHHAVKQEDGELVLTGTRFLMRFSTALRVADAFTKPLLSWIRQPRESEFLRFLFEDDVAIPVRKMEITDSEDETQRGEAGIDG